MNRGNAVMTEPDEALRWAKEAEEPVPVDVEALRDLYRRRDRLAEEVAAVDREIKAKAALWAQERRMFGLGPDGVRRMLFQPY